MHAGRGDGGEEPTIYHVNRVKRTVWDWDLKPNRVNRSVARICTKKPNRTVVSVKWTNEESKISKKHIRKKDSVRFQ